jgi:hypothetical protein
MLNPAKGDAMMREALIEAAKSKHERLWEPRDRVAEILVDVKRLAAEYYVLTRKPLGVTGEVAELAAAEKLGVTLTPARTIGYDAVRETPLGPQRIQIKARAILLRVGKSRRRWAQYDIATSATLSCLCSWTCVDAPVGARRIF